MADINDMLKNLNNTLESLKSLLEEKKEELKNATEGTKEYRDIEKKIAKIENAIENVSDSIKNKIESTLEDIESSINKSEKTATQKIKEGFEERRKFIEENVKDEEKRNQLLLGLQKEYDKKVLELEKSEYEKRKNLIKSSLVGENQTVFEQLNERFEKEQEEYKKHGLDTLELEKAYNRKRAKLFLDQSQQLVGAISNLVSAGEAQVNDIANSWAVINQGAHDYGRVVGLTASQIQNLNEKTLSFWSDNDITYKFNVGLDEFYKIMGAYNKELGRAVALTNDSMVNLVSMKNILGEEQAIKFTANLDKFGLDVDATKELVEGIVGDARRSGIVLSNLTQNVADNLHLAQQYTFEDGIEGLVKMAEKASAVKWNMQQTAAFAEKVNNVEGAIKTGAQLSVLGGPFARFSNPMGMLYESLNDMEGLQDRIFAMFGSLGEWNQEKGMLDVSTFDKQRIRAAASAMGLNYGDVMNTVQTQARRNVVMEQIKNYGLDKNTTELIANTAQIDRETGRAYVNYEGKKIFANEIGGHKDKDKILKYLETQANSQDENLRDIAQNTLGAKELAEAAVKEVMVDKADMYEYMRVTKNGFQDTVYAIEQSKAVLNQINIVLNAIQSIVGVIAATSAFKGAFGGGMENGGARGIVSGGKYQIYDGPKGKMIGVDGRTSLQRVLMQKGGIWNKTKAGAIGAWNRTKNFMKNGGGAMALAAGGYIGGSLMSNQSERLREKGLHGDADNVNLGAGALTGIGTGAAIGATIGSFIPVIGNAVGGIVGGLIGGTVGLFSANAENEERRIERRNEEIAENIEKEKEDIYHRTGFWLNGDYDLNLLTAIRRGTNNYSSTLRRIMEQNGDGGVIEQLPPTAFAQGGLLQGSSHNEGGMNVIDNNTGEIVAEVEGNEGVVPKNIMEKFGTVDNLINSAMRPLQPMGETLLVEHTNNSPINSSLNVGGSANVNVGGSIQLSMPGGQTYNIADDPAAMRMIGDNVMRHIMTANQQIFNKSEFYRKW